MREADFPCVEMLCDLVQHKGKGPGQIISKFEGIHEFHQIRCIRRSRAFSRHAQTCICDRDMGYRPVEFTCDVTPRRASLDNFLALECSALSDGGPTEQKSENY
jgi:hypothetical protein